MLLKIIQQQLYPNLFFLMKGTSNKIRYMNKGTFQYVVSFLYDKYFSSLGLMTRRLYHTERSICWIKQPWLRHNRHRARRTKVWVLMRIRCGRSSHRDGHQTTTPQRPTRGRKRPRRAEGGGKHEGDGTPGSCAGCRGGAHVNALLGTLWMGGWGEVLLQTVATMTWQRAGRGATREAAPPSR